MADLLLAFAFATFVWFFATGAILWLNRLPREQHEGAVVAAIPLLAVGACGIIVAAGETTPAAAYLAFVSAVLIWGWHELAFLMGVVTGPNRQPLPPGVAGLARFRASAGTVIHHELALFLTLLLIAGLSWGAPNQVGSLTFGLLFALRLSAKLNIFLGVPHFSSAMLPPHLGYLRTHFRRRRMNPLMPVSLAAGALLVGWLARHAGHDTGAALIMSLVILGLLEHGFMLLPFRDDALWRWAMPHQAATSIRGRKSRDGL
ncbi:MAG: putative photosynthetic complex assembly protein PuhE [Sphingomonadaceae bacterium]|uniref:putative photosynthetic complex assembly protein PuhE n=1 Tax=Thermaurantiacus sp. TaxID=2820283 RepID=UPI00298F244D|nr:putative photosynthetic complex assembly protein PuhE [Thermaurantiacus sp.]MCS6987811.1 putative photosynthetic complex assembly protein PuhE [Sphingomonadaceae bacterium]MDW8414969.1 putative photosynthetic complex assembly protein PuhE [Thermaurantiacus sp.]